MRCSKSKEDFSRRVGLAAAKGETGGRVAPLPGNVTRAKPSAPLCRVPKLRSEATERMREVGRLYAGALTGAKLTWPASARVAAFKYATVKELDKLERQMRLLALGLAADTMGLASQTAACDALLATGDHDDFGHVECDQLEAALVAVEVGLGEGETSKGGIPMSLCACDQMMREHRVLGACGANRASEAARVHPQRRR